MSNKLEYLNKKMFLSIFLIVSVFFITHQVKAQQVVNETIESKVESKAANFKITKLIEGLEHPWGITWLSDGRMLITERPGRVLLVEGDNITSLDSLFRLNPSEEQGSITEGGQGGLLDVVAHPDYAVNGWIYFTFSSPGDDDSNFGEGDYATGTALGRAKINSEGTALEDLEVLYTQMPRTEPGRHYGSRIVFPGDGTVLFSIGDRGIRYPSQNLTDPGGSIIRLNDDGSVAMDNPFVNKEPGNLRPEIFSFGHRNNQGMAINPHNGEIWATEHGPFGGDLVHLIEKGNNYGWPQVTQGVEYDTKVKIGLGKEAPGVTPPKHIWEESMAPSGLAFYHKGNIAEWNSSLFAGSLLKERIHRLTIKNGEIVDDEILLEGITGRIRDVRMGPDGNLYLLTDHEDGGLFRIEPVDE